MSTYELEAASPEAAVPASVTALAGFDVGNPLIETLFVAQAQYLWVDDVNTTLAALAAATSVGIIDGEPLWLMLVGSSSGGKGEDLRLLEDVAQEHHKDITLPGMLAVSNKKNDAGKRQGILARLGDDCNALMTITDFSSMLGGADGRSMSGASKQDLFNALRDIYDGAYRRQNYHGSAEWTGRLSMIAACTPTIDRYAAHSDSLGTRWLYFRLAERTQDDRRSISQMVTTRTDINLKRKAARDLASEIVRQARLKAPTVRLTDDLEALVIECGLLASAGRANVPRDYRGDIDGIADREEPGRATHQLRLLARSLVALDLKPEVVVDVLRHAASSSMPLQRSRALSVLVEQPTCTFSTYRVAQDAGMDAKVAKRALEDWHSVGVINVSEPNPESLTDGYQWWLSDDYRDTAARVTKRV